MPDPAIADELGTFVMIALLFATALLAAWMPFARLSIARQVRAGTLQRETGVALLRRLNSGLLVLILGSVIFSAPFSPFDLPHSHALASATTAIEVCALLVYLWVTFAMRRVG
jgi:hypothetical protein